MGCCTRQSLKGQWPVTEVSKDPGSPSTLLRNGGEPLQGGGLGQAFKQTLNSLPDQLPLSILGMRPKGALEQAEASEFFGLSSTPAGLRVEG